MKWFKYESPTPVWIVRFDRGDDMLESFNDFLRQNDISDGAVVSGIGTFDQCRMHFIPTIDDPAKIEIKEWRNTPLELASVSGIVANGEAHLHMVISTIDRAWGGHMEPGCKVLFLGEFVFLETPGFGLERMRRSQDPKSLDYALKFLVKK
jgi:predicted DNA-binding protein with PD1-like motif